MKLSGEITHCGANFAKVLSELQTVQDGHLWQIVEVPNWTDISSADVRPVHLSPGWSGPSLHGLEKNESVILLELEGKEPGSTAVHRQLSSNANLWWTPIFCALQQIQYSYIKWFVSHSTVWWRQTCLERQLSFPHSTRIAAFSMSELPKEIEIKLGLRQLMDLPTNLYDIWTEKSCSHISACNRCHATKHPSNRISCWYVRTILWYSQRVRGHMQRTGSRFWPYLAMRATLFQI